MRYYDKNNEDDVKEATQINAKDWQLELLNLNPEYCFWGNFEDYMLKKDSGWDSSIEYKTWSKTFELDDYNECVNFYFTIHRNSVECKECKGSGLNKETKKLSDDWYSFDDTFWIYTENNKRFNNKAWQYHINDSEVEALVKAGRLSDFFKDRVRYNEETKTWTKYDKETKQNIVIDKPTMPTAEEVNHKMKYERGIGHDAINQWICVKQRAMDKGVYGFCPECNGSGLIYTEPNAKVGLQLWIIHPRKGASRGVFIHEIKKTDIENVINFLKNANERNTNRFTKVVNYKNEMV